MKTNIHDADINNKVAAQHVMISCIKIRKKTNTTSCAEIKKVRVKKNRKKKNQKEEKQKEARNTAAAAVISGRKPYSEPPCSVMLYLFSIFSAFTVMPES